MKIVVVRNDKLGDFMLAYPAFALLKRSMPAATVCALVPEYTREMAECCPWIDRLIIDPGAGVQDLARALSAERCDAAIALFSTRRVAAALAIARVPYRLAPATKWFQWIYNHRLAQRRSQSAKPESEYNVDLVRRFLDEQRLPQAALPEPPYLAFPSAEVVAARERILIDNRWPETSRLVFVHAGSGGSARNLSNQQFESLSRFLLDIDSVRIVFTAGPAEVDAARKLASVFPGRASTFESQKGLRNFAVHIAAASVFISGSTGPLHIAGALDRPTAAFYTRRQSATALRWQTLNAPVRRLAFSPPESAPPEDMSSIDIAAAASAIKGFILSS